MTAQLRSWAAALGGDVSGRSVQAPGPGHSTKDRSLSVTPSASAPNGFLVHSFSGDDPIACLDYVRAKLGLPAFASQKPAAGARRGVPGRRDSGASARAPQAPPDNGALEMAIWNESRDPLGTLVQVHLDTRRVGLPDEAANESIRYHPNCPFWRERFPAMVCLVRNIITNEPQGVHRTALAAGGAPIKSSNGKTLRMSLGSIVGGAIKLDPDEHVEQGVCIGEGVETCLAGRQMGLRPVWSVVNSKQQPKTFYARANWRSPSGSPA
jgi:putative DNA primase/helicase